MSLGLAVVTVSKDNPLELGRTLSSVSSQTLRPNTHLVVDSSSSAIRDQMQCLARVHSAEYLWVKPDGVYGAFNSALEYFGEDYYVWFLNSGDVLVGRESISLVEKELWRAEDEFGFVVGDLILGVPGNFSSLASTKAQKKRPPREFERFDWFPHPSTVVKKSRMLAVGGFNERFQIAADYSLLLKVLERFGRPYELTSPLALHTLDGISSRNKGKAGVERAAARLSVFGAKGLWTEIQYFLRKFPQIVLGASSLHAGNLKVPNGGHFCEAEESDRWPDCCLDFLIKQAEKDLANCVR